MATEANFAHDQLLRAVHEGNKSAVDRALRVGGANMEGRDESGWTALHHATRSCALGSHGVGMLRLLLRYGADANASSAAGTRALHIAAHMGSLAAATVLLGAAAALPAGRC